MPTDASRLPHVRPTRHRNDHQPEKEYGVETKKGNDNMSNNLAAKRVDCRKIWLASWITSGAREQTNLVNPTGDQ